MKAAPAPNTMSASSWPPSTVLVSASTMMSGQSSRAVAMAETPKRFSTGVPISMMSANAFICGSRARCSGLSKAICRSKAVLSVQSGPVMASRTLSGVKPASLRPQRRGKTRHHARSTTAKVGQRVEDGENARSPDRARPFERKCRIRSLHSFGRASTPHMMGRRVVSNDPSACILEGKTARHLRPTSPSRDPIPIVATPERLRLPGVRSVARRGRSRARSAFARVRPTGDASRPGTWRDASGSRLRLALDAICLRCRIDADQNTVAVGRPSAIAPAYRACGPACSGWKRAPWMSRKRRSSPVAR